MPRRRRDTSLDGAVEESRFLVAPDRRTVYAVKLDMTRRGPDSMEDPSSAPEETALVPASDVATGWDRAVGDDATRLDEIVHASLEQAWMQLGNGWSSVVVVPCTPGDSTRDIARALCATGSRLSPYATEFVDGGELDRRSFAGLYARLTTASEMTSEAEAPSLDASSNWAPPIRKIIASAPSPLENPFVLPVVNAADGVVLCVRRGADRIDSVRATIYRLGHTPILCCLLLG